MTDRIEALERLQRLRETGAISEEEFEREKALLTAAAAAPASTARDRRIWLWVVGVLGLILLATLVWLLAVRPGAQDGALQTNNQVVGNMGSEDAEANVQRAPKPTMRDRPEAEQLAVAFRAVFGRDGPVPRPDLGAAGGRERAARMLWTTFGPVLLTEAELPDGCHVCAGYVGAYYLRDTGTGFEVAARYPEAAPGSSWGAPPQEWRLVDNFTTYPALYYEGGYTGQGHTSLSATLVEFRPEGPSMTSIDLGADNAGAVGDDSPDYTGYEGAIRNVVRNRSFDVVYTGTCAFTERYVWRGNKFETEPGQRPACAG